MSNLSKIILVLVVNIILFFTLGQSRIIYADDIASDINQQYDNEYIYGLKVTTGEKLIDQGESIYKCDIYSNKSMVTFQVKLSNGNKPSDFIVTDDDNTIIGSIDGGTPCLVTVNLKPGENIVIIKNKKDNSQLYKIYVNYINVQVKGIKDSVYVGDNLKLQVKKDDNMFFDNVKWSSSGIDTVMISNDGNITALNSGIANVIGTIYDDSNNIIGNVNIDFNVCGEKASGWISNNGKWYYIDEFTRTIKIGWIFSNGEWYYTDAEGAMKTGWIYENGSWYYLKENGVMATSWIKDNGKWYLLDSGGAMKKGWAKDHGNWYYLNNDGSMQTSAKIINGVKYNFNSHGEMQGNINNIKN